MTSPFLLRSLVALAPLLCTACFDSLDFGGGEEECGGPSNLGPSSSVGFILGEKGKGGFASPVCGEDGCSAVRPLAVGARHRIFIVVEASDYEHEMQIRKLTLVSETPDVLALEAVRPYEEITDEGTWGVCEESTREVGVGANLVPKKPGSARLTLKEGNVVLDHFTLVVAAATTLRVDASNLAEPMLVNVTAGKLEVNADDQEVKLAVHALTADGKEVAVAAPEWTIPDEGQIFR
jgi:hypothetical protein